MAKDPGDGLGIVPVRTIWLDVQRQRIHPDAPGTSGNPVFNVHRGFGHVDAETGRRVCAWPLENCARFDVYGDVTPQQGTPVGGILGADWTMPQSWGEGTLIGLGGHVHPGGIRDEVGLVRGGAEKLIHVSDAVYWDRDDPATQADESQQAGGPMTSWDFSMTVTGAPLGWKVKIKPGDTLRLNAVYDSQDASWYENMGIVVAIVALDDFEKEDAAYGGRGVDVFDEDVIIDRGVPKAAYDEGIVPAGWQVGAWTPAQCTPDFASTPRRLCVRGVPTHGHLAEASEFGGCPGSGCPPLRTPDSGEDGPLVGEIQSVAFTYGLASHAQINRTGIPRVVRGTPLRLWNYDTVADVWHTYTRCLEPCTGTFGLDYPLADGGAATNPDEAMADDMDFDSTEIGWGVSFSPASGQFGDDDKPPDEALRDGLYFDGFTPTQNGVYTFFCRIHPWMRGAFKVVDP